MELYLCTDDMSSWLVQESITFGTSLSRQVNDSEGNFQLRLRSAAPLPGKFHDVKLVQSEGTVFARS